MSQRDAVRRVENLGPRPPHSLYYSVFKAPAPHPRHLLTFEAAAPHSKYQLCTQGICSVSSVPTSCVQRPLCIQNLFARLTHSNRSAHFRFALKAKPWNLSAPAPASFSFPLPSLLRPTTLHATGGLCSDLGVHASLPFPQVSYPCKQEPLFSRETFPSTLPICSFPDFLFPQFFLSC